MNLQTPTNHGIQFSSGPSATLTMRSRSAPKKKPKQLPSLAALKRQLAAGENASLAKAESNAQKLISRKRI